MAGHSKFKNIQHRKGAQDKKRAKLFTKLAREIITAAKSGQPDPELNPRLRTAISNARSHNLPKDRIERAISQASNSNADNYEEMRYEGYAPGGIAIIVEALTDNKNRSASDIRAAFSKYGGNLGETGSVSFMFDHLGCIVYPNSVAEEEVIFEIALESGASDVESDEGYHYIYTSVEDFGFVNDQLTRKFGDPEDSNLIWKAQIINEISDIEKAQKIFKLVDVLEDNDDVQRVFGNYSVSEEISSKILD